MFEIITVVGMPHIHLPIIQCFKAPGSDREIQLRLYNDVYFFTTTVGTQTDPEVFFVNGKPARAVQPFRVVPYKPKEIVPQISQLDLAHGGQSFQIYNAQAVSNIQILQAWPIASWEEQQPEGQEMAEASGSGVQEMQSVETQTDMEYINVRTDTASALEDSIAE